jgi:hypothetical protein
MSSAGQLACGAGTSEAVVVHEGPPAAFRWRLLAAVIAPLILGIAMLAPVVALAWLGLSPVGLTEESTGYRYFYSLRTLYTADERPWLPQGQVMTLVHIVLQALLTLAGFPITQLTPRMELFAYFGAGIADVCTAIAALWALRPIRSIVGQLTVVTVMVCTIFDMSLAAGYHLIVPDYHPWIHVVSLVAIGCTLRLAARRQAPTTAWIVGLGVFTGLSISLKVTLLAFAGPPILLALMQLGSWRRTVTGLCIIVAIAASLFVGITWLSYGGNTPAVVRYFQLMVGFAGTLDAGRQVPFSFWFSNRLFGESYWTLRMSAALPLLLAASALLLRPRLISATLLPSCVFALLLSWKRDDTTTLIEVMDASLMALVVWSTCVAAPLLRRPLQLVRVPEHQSQRAGWPALLAKTTVSCALVLVSGFVGGRAVWQMLPPFSETDAAQKAIDRFMSESPGKVAVLTPDNERRTLTRDSAIFKGGTNVGESHVWGVSPFVASLVPDRHYFFPAQTLHTPIDLAPFTYLLFASQEQLKLTEARLTKALGASLIGFECPLALQVPGLVEHACRRVPDQPIGESHGAIAFATSSAVLAAGGPVAWNMEPRRPLRPGELAFVASTHEIWRLEAPGSFVRMRGDAGQSVQVETLGAWSREREAPTGARATYDGTRWSVTGVPTREINRNPTLRMQPDGSIRGWDLLTRDMVEVDRQSASLREDPPDGWLQVRARNDGLRVGVRTGLDTDGLAGRPAMAVVNARAFGQGRLSARIGGVGAGNTVTVADSSGDDSKEIVALGRWESLIVRLEPDQLVGGRLAIIVELHDARAGDRLDISRVELFTGRYP